MIDKKRGIMTKNRLDVLTVLDITLQQITAFFKVAEYLSFTRAAEAMYISQPALSRIVARFEKGVNTTLFVRKSHGIELTEKGRQLYDELLPLFIKITKAIKAADDNSGKENKTLRIACHTSFDLKKPHNSFRATIEEYNNKHPDVTVTIQLFELTELKDSLLDGDVDMIYSVSTTFENLKALSYKTIEDIPLYIAMSEKHQLASAQTLPLDKLSEEDFYFISSISAESLLALCKQVGVTPKRIKLLHNYPSVVMAVRQGKGVTLCGIDVKYTYGADINFFEIPNLHDKPQMVLAWSPERTSPETREFITMIP